MPSFSAIAASRVAVGMNRPAVVVTPSVSAPGPVPLTSPVQGVRPHRRRV